MTIGTAAAAFALEEFLIPSTILDGGVMGISIILAQILKRGVSLFVIVLNLPFLIVGFRQLGWRFLIRGTYCMLLLAGLLELFKDVPAITNTELLAVVFGGVILGFGVGTVIRYGGCLDGTEIVAMLLSKKLNFSVGQIIFAINIAIYAVAGLLFGWDRALYSLLTYFISFKIIDMVEIGMEQAKAVMIITNEGRNIADELYKSLGRTCTLLEGEGLISGKKVVLYCVVTRIELAEVKRIVNDDDASAFVTVTDVSEIIGKHIKNTNVEILTEGE
ncbi:MAG: YitT family protein [Clostridia bacterium]|nr:YitT family protein [Clostridia bacterium]MCI8979100.1 YitT family protein [Clostridia bacterium]MCI9085517.1 YitT family protein [Clostridia bacterium]